MFFTRNFGSYHICSFGGAKRRNKTITIFHFHSYSTVREINKSFGVFMCGAMKRFGSWKICASFFSSPTIYFSCCIGWWTQITNCNRKKWFSTCFESLSFTHITNFRMAFQAHERLLFFTISRLSKFHCRSGQLTCLVWVLWIIFGTRLSVVTLKSKLTINTTCDALRQLQMNTISVISIMNIFWTWRRGLSHHCWW